MRAVRSACHLFRRFRRADSGATAIEYALIAVGISIAVAAAVMATGSNLKVNFYDKVNEATTN